MPSLIFVPLNKLISYRPFWFILAGILLLIFTLVTILTSINQQVISGSNLPLLKFSYPDIWFNMSWLVKLSNYFFALLLIFLISADKENLCLRQHVIDGWSREDALFSYHTLCFLFALFSLALTVILSLTYGEKSSGEFIGQNDIKTLLCFTLQCFMIFQFALLMTIIARKAVPSVILFLGWQIAFEPILGNIIDSKIRKGYSELLPFHAAGKLLPDLNPMGIRMGAQTVVANNYIYVSLGYAAIFSLICWARLKSSDL